MPLSSKTVRQEIMEANKILNQPVKPESKTKTAEEWLIVNSYPEFMNMTRDNLEIILIRYSDQQLAAFKEALTKVRNLIYEKDEETGGWVLHPDDIDFGTILTTIDKALDL
jgi:hypothetical protein